MNGGTATVTTLARLAFAYRRRLANTGSPADLTAMIERAGQGLARVGPGDPYRDLLSGTLSPRCGRSTTGWPRWPRGVSTVCAVTPRPRTGPRRRCTTSPGTSAGNFPMTPSCGRPSSTAARDIQKEEFANIDWIRIRPAP